MPPQSATTLLAATQISASGTSTANVGWHRYEDIFGIFNVTAVPSGGAPTLDVYLQASPDGGTTWRDIAAFQFTGSVATRQFAITKHASGGTSMLAASDGALASGTVVQGPFGDRLRVKYTFAAGGSTGSYTLSVSVAPSGGP